MLFIVLYSLYAQIQGGSPEVHDNVMDRFTHNSINLAITAGALSQDGLEIYIHQKHTCCGDVTIKVIYLFTSERSSKMTIITPPPQSSRWQKCAKKQVCHC